ncbi:unnamed protein product [Paramecium pentaurelia]|uniref:Uncharacterized protein n=1 Tax=Paramecium pentaurelia TaxID=43138 RepID=A0A8S1TF19_9CILI|nr:unnamed protein product [Paramecium pentaurelia]
MQQKNYTPYEFTHQEQSTQEQQQSKKYSIKESIEFQQFNPLGLSLFLEANCQQELIAKQIFAPILKMIEDKLLEIDQRLDNRDEIKFLNAQINLLKPSEQYFAQKQHDDTQSEQIQQRKFSDLSNIDIISAQIIQTLDTQQIQQKPLRSRSQIANSNTVINRNDIKNTSNTDGLCQKIEQFENKLNLLIEQMNKISQKECQFSEEVEQQINDQLKDSLDRLIQNEQYIKQVYSTNQETSENQREFLTHLQQMRQEINYLSQEQTRIQDENKIIIQQFEQNYLEIQKQIRENKNELILQKSCIECIDNDFLIILKKFKDLYHELAKKKFNSSQLQKPLQ